MATRRVRAFLGAVETIAEGLNNQMFASMYKEALRSRVEDKDNTLFSFLSQLERTPVGIDEFIDGTEFLGATDFRLWPEVRKAVREMNANWWKPLGKGAFNEAVLCGATGCVDNETEYLTPNGWKAISDFAEGDEVAQYRADGKVYFAAPRGYVKAPCREFLAFEARSVSQRLTLGHTFVYRTPKGKQLKSKTALEVATQHNNADYGFRGEILGAFDGLVRREGLRLGDAELRVMCAVMADGHYPNKTDRVVLRLKKERKQERLEQLLSEAGIAYTNDECSPYGGFRAYKFVAPMRSKSYADLWGANQHQLQIIADEVLHWDGEITYKERFFTSLKEDADFVQFVFASIGKRSSVREFCRDHVMEYTVNVEDKDFTTIASGDPESKSPIPLVQASDGYCYCFRTDTGMWLMRRNGVMAVTGNTGKTSIAIVTILYHLYLLSCMKNPQGWYGFPKATSIVFAIMGAKPRVVNKVIYLPMRKLVESMPYFQKYMPPDKLLESEMYFPDKNIRVAQSGVDEDSLLGEAIIGGIIDEINFMNIVLRSKKAEVTSGRAGMYDQAEQVFSTMQRRKRGRFTRPGPCIGIVIPSSSTRYKGDFTDKRRQFVVKNEIKTAYVYSPKQYEVVPQERFSGRTFRLVIGNDVYHDTRVLRDDEATPEGAWVENVPVEYIDDFLNRPYDALRDVLGISNNAVAPFIKSRHKIYECVEAGKDVGLQSILVRDHVILGEHGMPQVKAGTYCMNPSRPRFVHIDLSRNADRCGIAMLRFEGMKEVKRQNGMTERLPVATLEVACTITPDANNEIDVAEVRAWVKHLRMKYGYPIKAVSYDGVDSRESIQAWRKDGMRAAMVSVDRSSAPYKQLRDAMYDTRILMPEDDLLVSEIIDLEYDEGKDKVDHPVNGSKDLSDAVCGAYTNMLERKSTWTAAAVDDANYEESQRAVFDSRFDAPRSA